MKNERLQSDLDTVMELYRFAPCLYLFRLIPGPNSAQVPADAEEGRCAQALEAIQSGAGPSQVMEALKSGASSNVGPNNTIDRLNDLITKPYRGYSS